MKNSHLLALFFLTLPLGISCSDSKKQTALNECATGNGEACRTLGMMLESENPAAAKNYFANSCNLGNTQGCIRLGEVLIKEGKKDDAIEKFRIACQKGNSAGCVKQAELLKEAVPARE